MHKKQIDEARVNETPNEKRAAKPIYRLRIPSGAVLTSIPVIDMMLSQNVNPIESQWIFLHLKWKLCCELVAWRLYLWQRSAIFFPLFRFDFCIFQPKTSQNNSVRLIWFAAQKQFRTRARAVNDFEIAALIPCSRNEICFDKWKTIRIATDHGCSQARDAVREKHQSISGKCGSNWKNINLMREPVSDDCAQQ